MATAAANVPPDGQEGGEGEAKLVVPQSDPKTDKKIVAAFKAFDKHKQDRKAANEHLQALREDLVTLGFSKNAQKVVALFMKLNEQEQEYFDRQVVIMRKALGKPVQGVLELIDGGKGG